MKHCDVCGKDVEKLWHSRRTDKNNGKIIRPSRCTNCINKQWTPKKPENKEELDVFFANASLVFPDRCENCGKKLNKSTAFDRRAQTCHILPKTKNGGFPKVAIHPSNKIFMCCFSGCYGHSNWDNQDAAKRKTMPVYKLAIERFREFEDSLTESEKIKAHKYLGIN